MKIKNYLVLDFFDLKINQEKLNKLLNYIEKNTETSIENQADSSKKFYGWF